MGTTFTVKVVAEGLEEEDRLGPIVWRGAGRPRQDERLDALIASVDGRHAMVAGQLAGMLGHIPTGPPEALEKAPGNPQNGILS